MSAPKLLFLATEDWFFRSHFMPMLRRARQDGFEVVLAARASGALGPEDLDGARLIDTGFARGSLRLGDLVREISHMRGLIAAERPDIVHCVALKPVAHMLLADLLGARGGRVFAVTGRGYLAVHKAAWTRPTGAILGMLLRQGLRSPRAVLAVENEEDRVWAERGAPLPDRQVVLMPGAGVDETAYTPMDEPPAPPIVIGIASRLVWSKGVDVAVEALSRLRARGIAAELHIAGAPDLENPECVREAVLARWRRADGIKLLGAVKDMNAFWSGAHIACLPSRGGEGLPRTLLEAGACGRAIVTTAVPGCRRFVEHGRTGFLVRPDDPAALTEALARLAGDPALRARLGAAARARVVEGYTYRHVADQAAQAWRIALGD